MLSGWELLEQHPSSASWLSPLLAASRGQQPSLAFTGEAEQEPGEPPVNTSAHITRQHVGSWEGCGGFFVVHVQHQHPQPAAQPAR